MIYGYKWDFGDGTSAVGKTVEHTFVDDGQGIYQVKLSVVDDKGAQAEKIKTI